MLNRRNHAKFLGVTLALATLALAAVVATDSKPPTPVATVFPTGKNPADRRPATLTAVLEALLTELGLDRDCLDPPVRGSDVRRLAFERSGSTTVEFTGDDIPRAVHLRESCRATLVTKAQDVTRHYMLSRSQTFPYEASAARGYCGTSPSPSANCDAGRAMGPDFLVFDMSMRRAPSRISRDLAALRGGRGGTHHTGDYLFLGFDSAGSGTPTTPLWTMTHYGRSETMASGQLGYVYYPRGSLTRDSLSPYSNPYEEINSQIESSIERLTSSGRHPVGPANALQEDLQAKARILKEYWEKSMDALDHGLPDWSTFGRTYESLADLDAHSSSAVTTVSTLTDSVLNRAVHTILLTNNVSDAIDAAAYWWSIRDFRTQFACDADAGHPRSGREIFIESEYDQQECRRVFTEDIYLALSRSLASRTGRLQLDSPQWVKAHALTSRRERSDLYLRATNILLRQIERGQYPSRAEWGLIATQAAQTARELAENRILIWKGFDTMDPTEDRPVLTKELDGDETYLGFKQLLRRAAAVLGPDAWTQAELALPLYETWQLLQEPLDLGPWPCTSFNPSTVDAEEIATHLRSTDRSHWPALLRVSLANVRHHPEGELPHCMAWINAVGASSGADPADRWEEVGITGAPCLALIPAWATSSVRPLTRERLSALCNNDGHRRACITLGYVATSAATPESPTAWVELLTVPRLPQSFFSSKVREFLALAEAGIRGGGSAGRAWSAAVDSVHESLHARALENLGAVPTAEEYTSCMGPDTWQGIARRLPELASSITLREGCPPELAGKTRQWAHMLGMMYRYAFRSDVAYRDELGSGLIAFGTWLQALSGSRRAARGVTTTAAHAAEFRGITNYDDLLRAYLRNLGPFDMGETTRAVSLFWRIPEVNRRVRRRAEDRLRPVLERQIELQGDIADCLESRLRSCSMELDLD